MMSDNSLKERTAKGLIWGGLSNGLMQLIGAVFGMVLLVYLTPKDQGKVAVLYIFSAIASAMQESGFIAALCNKKEPTHEEYNAVFWFNLMVGAALYIILWFCAPAIARFYEDPDLTALSRVLFLGFLLSSLGTVQRAYLFGHLMVKQTSICSLTAMIVSGIVGVTMAANGFAHWAIVSQAVCFVLVSQIMVWYFSPWRPTLPGGTGRQKRPEHSHTGSEPSPVNSQLSTLNSQLSTLNCQLSTVTCQLSTFLAPAWRMFGFSSKLMLTNIVNICNLHAFSVLLGKFFGEHTAGIYSTARRWDDMASNTINGMVNGVAQPTLTQVKEDIGRYRQVFRKMLRFTCFVTFPAMFGLSIIAQDFILLVGKEKWAECGTMLAILCIHGAVVPITTLYSNLTISRGRSDVNMICTVAQCLAVWTGLLLLYPKGLMPMVIYFISLNVAWLGIWQWWAKRLVGLRWREAVTDILPFLVFTLAVHSFTWWVTAGIPFLWARLLSRIVVAGVLYAGIMWVSGAKIMRETIQYLAPTFSPEGEGKTSDPSKTTMTINNNKEHLPSGRAEGGRNHAFDILCGLCILRMVTLHVVCQTSLRQAEWWKPIMEWSFYLMSFFFFKAGYFNKGVQGNSRAYCLDKFRRLMIPYFSWAAISAAICLFFMLTFPGRFPGTEHSFHTFRIWIGGFTWGNSPLWFLPCFFTSYIMVHFIEKVKHLNLIILFFPLLSYWLFTLGNPLYLMMNNVFCGAFFFYLGKVWHRILDRIGDSTGLVLSIILAAAFILCNIYLHGEYEMRTNSFTGPFWQVMLNTVLALTGLSGILLTTHVRRIPGICYIGEHSMVYYIGHYPLIMLYVFLSVLLEHNIKRSVPDMMIMTLLVFAICTLLVPFIESVFWLSGKSLPQPLPRRGEQGDKGGGRTVYFYHTQDTMRIVREWKEGKFPAHFLYGALQLQEYGFDVIWHDQVHVYKRVQDTLKATWKILTCRQHYDTLYATHTRGIEPVILLHALGLYRKRIVVWHHQPVVKAKNWLREALARLFYKGMDHMIFFSEKLIRDSLKSSKADPARMSMVHWGADLAFYDSLQPDGESPCPFISTGKELRDYRTLTEAFNNTGQPLTLYTAKEQREAFRNLEVKENIDLHFGTRLMPYELSLLVAQSDCVCICCQPSDYTVGLTTVVEAMALGKPVLCTRNLQMPMDLEAEGCGIWLEPYDREGWERAIRYITGHPEEAREMGRKGRLLAEKYYNVQQCAREVTPLLLPRGGEKDFRS